MKRKAGENQYFHPDFHSSMNMGIDYLGNQYGQDEVRAYLYQYTDHVLAQTQQDVKARGVTALKDFIEGFFQKEHAKRAVELEILDQTLSVHIMYNPAIQHLRQTGRTVSKWYPYTTSMILERLADNGNIRLDLKTCDENTGEARFRLVG